MKILGFTEDEIDAAECWLTIAGAKELGACPEAIDQWECGGSGKKKITVQCLKKFDARRRHTCGALYVRLWARMRRALDPRWDGEYLSANYEARKVSWRQCELAVKAMIMSMQSIDRP